MCLTCLAYLKTRSRASYKASGKTLDTIAWDDSISTVIGIGGNYKANPNKTKHDWISVDGDAELGGKLEVSLVNNFKLKKRQYFEIVNIKGDRTGEFEDLKEGDVVGKFKGKKRRKEKLYITYEAGDGNDVAVYTKNGFRKIRGSKVSDTITGTEKGERIYGTDGDDWIDGGNGKDKIWGKGGADTFKIPNMGKSHAKIMDYEDGVDRIEFCGCKSTQIITKDGNAHISKGGDLEAIILGVVAEDLAMDGIYIS